MMISRKTGKKSKVLADYVDAPRRQLHRVTAGVASISFVLVLLISG
jgi:hypothetical protein